MIPSRDAILEFTTIIPEISECAALRILEGAESVDDAIGQYFEHQARHAASIMPNQVTSPEIAGDADIRVQRPPPYATRDTTREPVYRHSSAFNEAASHRCKDEQDMQAMLRRIQRANRIFNADIEPEHHVENFPCDCDIHKYMETKISRLPILEMWSKAVMYPGEAAYNDFRKKSLFGKSPYGRVPSPFGVSTPGPFRRAKPVPRYYDMHLLKISKLNKSLNTAAQAAIEAMEMSVNIWETENPDIQDSDLSPNTRDLIVQGHTFQDSHSAPTAARPKESKLTAIKKALSTKPVEQKLDKTISHARGLRIAILVEEENRWPTEEWRQLVAAYQETVGMSGRLGHLRSQHPIQYLHLLRAGYFEPIPASWARDCSSPLKFTIDAVSGWRGITPAWRGYRNTAEERLFWISNHRNSVSEPRMKLDVISLRTMAQSRMDSAIETPSQYFSPYDICKLESIKQGYSKQVPPSTSRPLGTPQTPLENTIILVEASDSMNSEPLRPIYDDHVITGYFKSGQRKHKETAKAITRRFTQAMLNNDPSSHSYQFIALADQARSMGCINLENLEEIWSNMKLGGELRIMPGWQKAKNLHLQKYTETATHHPIYGWQGGPKTPILRLLIVVDGEAIDIHEFELDLLGSSWAHVTVCLVGLDGCLDHHCYANELQRMSQANPRVSFVDAQGNTPERFVVHELLKRHLGYDLRFSDFELLEQDTVDLPSYAE